METIIFWILVFVLSLFFLVKGSDWLLNSAEEIGLHLGFSPFVIGVVLTGVGTSLPELASGIAGIFQGAPDIVIANAIGSNMANMLLVTGVAAVIGRHLIITKNLIDLELPLLAIATVLFLGAAYDGAIGHIEGIFLVVTYLVYLTYSVLTERRTSTVIAQRGEEIEEHLQKYKRKFTYMVVKPFFLFKEYIMFALGAVALGLGAHYTVESVIALSQIFGVATSLISISAIAFGTSLPELLVAVKAVMREKYEVAVGNVLGSNAFNVLMVVGIPSVAVTLPIETQTLLFAVPALALTTFLFIISGISRVIHHWEGMMFLAIYAFFIMKLFGVI